MSFMIYLIGSVDRLQNLALVAAIIAGVFMCVCLISGMIFTMMAGDALNTDPASQRRFDSDDWARIAMLIRAKALLGVRKAMPYMIVCGLLSVLIPDSKTMVAAYVIPKVANNEKLGSIVGTSADLINAQLSNWVSQVSSAVPVPAKPGEKK
jgi:hypothetical protein